MPTSTSSTLSVTCVQVASSIAPADNLATLRAHAEERTDLLVFPEAFARDFGKPGSALAAYTEAIDGEFVRAMRSCAAGTVVAGTFETNPDDPARPFNTLVATTGDQTATYRKVHLYDSFGFKESDVLSAGAIEPVIVEVGDFHVGLMTCYDLRFPEMTRLLVDAGADVIVVPAAWVAGPRKVEHWRTLLTARAVENTVYVVGVGQAGPRYTGHSMIVAPDGDVVAEAGEGEETISAELSLDLVREVRTTNPSLANRRISVG